MLQYIYRSTGQSYFQLSQKNNIIKFYAREYDPVTARMVSQTQEELQILNAYCRDNNIRLYILYTPIREEIEKEYFERILDTYKLNKDDYDRDRLYDTIKSFCVKNGINFIDVKSVLKANEGKKFYYERDQHWNYPGNGIVAQSIYGAIIKDLNT